MLKGAVMLDDLVQTVQTDFQRIAQQETLWNEDNFLERVRALDALTVDILEHIENVQYVHGYHPALGHLYHCATQLWQRLHAVNAQLFRRLREQLVADRAAGPRLRQMCATYVGALPPEPTWQDLEGDYLDVFINGLLDIGYPPEETKDRQPGMIGYHPTPARVILALIEHARLQEHDVFYDLGAGLGRVALLVGLLTAARAKGIEYEPAYCAYAQERADSLHLSRVTFLNADARQANYADGTVFFLYTPFTGRVLQAVLAQLAEQARCRPITLATYGACSHDAAQQSWLQATVQQTFAYDTLAFFRSR
jgi:hypothetical protein